MFKKGNLKDINNYRPLTISSNLRKIFAKIIQNRITKTINFNQSIAILNRIDQIPHQNNLSSNRPNNNNHLAHNEGGLRSWFIYKGIYLFSLSKGQPQ